MSFQKYSFLGLEIQSRIIELTGLRGRTHDFGFLIPEFMPAALASSQAIGAQPIPESKIKVRSYIKEPLK